MIHSTMRGLWNAVWKTLRCASHASERLADVQHDCDPIRICSISGLGIGPDITIVVRLNEQGYETTGSTHGADRSGRYADRGD
jgi:hypothetical protein